MQEIRIGDCLDVMRKMDPNSIDCIVTDPPYGLHFMGKDWDHGIPSKHFWEEALRISKPGTMLLAFGGTRTYHRLTCAIEDAGWEIRDCLMWLYGSGFPKSHNHFGLPGYGTALKPAYEPIIMAMKPLEGTYKQNAEKWGVAGINIDECRIRIEEDEREVMDNRSGSFDQCEDTVYKGHIGKRQEGKLFKSHAQGRWPANLLLDEEAAQALDEQCKGNQARCMKASGITMQSSSKNNIYGDFSKKEHKLIGFSDSGGASRFFYCAKASSSERNAGLEDLPLKKCGMMEDDNYAIKTGSGNLRDTKRQNFHPTVKPLALMKYLITLVMPPNPNAVVLDPFAGSGTTILAAKQLNRNAIGIELSPEYAEIARKRVESYKMPIEQFQLPLEDAKYA